MYVIVAVATYLLGILTGASAACTEFRGALVVCGTIAFALMWGLPKLAGWVSRR